MRLLVIMALLLGLSVTGVQARMSGPERAVLDGVNEYRAGIGLSVLAESDYLDAQAQEWANVQPSWPPDTCIWYGEYQACSLTGWGFVKASKFVTAITHSPDHRYWVERPDLLEAGVGRRGDIWVIMLGWRRTP